MPVCTNILCEHISQQHSDQNDFIFAVAAVPYTLPDVDKKYLKTYQLAQGVLRHGRSDQALTKY